MIKKKKDYLILAVISRGFSGRSPKWTQDVYHLFLHLLEHLLELCILEHQGLLSGLVVTEQGLVHVILVAIKGNVREHLSAS